MLKPTLFYLMVNLELRSNKIQTKKNASIASTFVLYNKTNNILKTKTRKMKKLILVLVAVLASTQIFANDKTSKETSEEKLRNEIVVLLDKPQIKLDQNEIKANIEFVLNAKGEIVILTVDSEKVAVEDYVKSRLNYKKVDSDVSVTPNKVYTFSLKVLNPKA